LKTSQTKKAAKLGISQNYLSQIYNGRKYPGWALVKRLQECGVDKPFEWWRNAKLSQIQKILDAIE
jgi:transcriptional regulator with XRE-family HTH domain